MAYSVSLFMAQEWILIFTSPNEQMHMKVFQFVTPCNVYTPQSSKTIGQNCFCLDRFNLDHQTRVRACWQLARLQQRYRTWQLGRHFSLIPGKTETPSLLLHQIGCLGRDKFVLNTARTKAGLCGDTLSLELCVPLRVFLYVNHTRDKVGWAGW